MSTKNSSQGALPLFYSVVKLIYIFNWHNLWPRYLKSMVQGDQLGCSLSIVDIKTKITIQYYAPFTRTQIDVNNA